MSRVGVLYGVYSSTVPVQTPGEVEEERFYYQLLPKEILWITSSAAGQLYNSGMRGIGSEE